MKTPTNVPWNIDSIVSELRELRVKSLESRQRERKPPKLPSRKVLVEIVGGLSSVLFPNRLGSGELTDEGIDYFVGHA
jgi:serine O-acetyltransferase